MRPRTETVVANPRGYTSSTRGREQAVDAELGRQRAVPALVARVRGEVGRLVELGRVDEQRDDDDVAFARVRAASATDGPRGRRPSSGPGRSSGPSRRDSAELDAQVGDSSGGSSSRRSRQPVPREPRARAWPPRAHRTALSSSGARSSTAVSLTDHGRLVAPCHRAGQRPLGAERRPVLDRRADQRDEQRRAVHARLGGQALGGGLRAVMRKFEAIDAAAW